MEDKGQTGERFVEDFLEHHGVKGMKWGVRKSAEQLNYKAKKAKAAGNIAKSDKLKAKAKARSSKAPGFRERASAIASNRVKERRERLIRGERRIKDVLTELSTTNILQLAGSGMSIGATAKRKNDAQKAYSNVIASGKASFIVRGLRSNDIAVNMTYSDLIGAMKQRQ